MSLKDIRERVAELRTHGRNIHYRNVREENACNDRAEAVALLDEAVEALDTIAGGHTNRFPGAPDVMSETPAEFRFKMWSWSQEVARAALAKVEEE